MLIQSKIILDYIHNNIYFIDKKPTISQLIVGSLKAQSINKIRKII